MLYFADYQWWEWHKDRAEYKAFAGERVTIENTGGLIRDPNVHMLHNYGTDGLSEQPNGIRTGTNGGYQALNIATLSGARRVLLLGYDMHFPGGKSHWHAGHPRKVPEQHYSGYARRFATIVQDVKRLGVEVINVTPGSKITCFPFLPLEQAL